MTQVVIASSNLPTEVTVGPTNEGIPGTGVTQRIISVARPLLSVSTPNKP